MEKAKSSLPPRPASICVETPSSNITQIRQLLKEGKSNIAPHLPYEHRIDKVPEPEDRLLTANMLFSGKNHLPNIPLLRQHLLRQGRLTQEAATMLIKQARDIFRKEPNLLTVFAPVVILGDIHGQFFDMLNVLDMLGSPTKTQYLFLGDYVDRGDYSTEVLFYLLAHKICYPTKVYMLRGNHETRLMCEYMTFLLECNAKYNIKVYNECLTLFDSLPLCAVIEGNVNGRVLCMHGGISPDIRYLSDIKAINRFCEPPGTGPLTDLLWSDPINEWSPDDPEWEGISRQEWNKITYVENTMRHTSYFFGRAALEPFLLENNLASIVRGHQVQDEGYMEHTFLVTDRPLPLCFTIFSAPNYCDQYNNQGALLSISASPFDIKTFLWKDHPFQLPEFGDGISYSLPYLLEHCVRILQDLVIAIKDDKQQTIEEVAADAKLKRKTELLFAKSAKIREQQEKYRAVLNENYHKNMSKFEKAVKSDRQNEQFPTLEMIASKQANHTGLLRRGASSPALLQRLQRDKTFLADKSTGKLPQVAQPKPQEQQQTKEQTEEQKSQPQVKRQASKNFKPRPKK
ncbi:serine/threonine protein phosphatase 2B catalytic subunit alpha isoform, putative [Entamoeba invadens IP1]|uniref:serine/threonine protein phosphatase 2B catalytic subunit alpha isoform, putative n=1 Tax=Entamoeba invadens IP1 TaxID=370355 RepID=UPI0002C3F616|nr:serine/threonine protein phosphatase 2B catalytic subunit alpha isoform, putative [Entamoeba invadens IP1]ELP93414.1 serine/threonine protein phosphatase 2B catalytic subunit alpha isoform, putative [Entamoeba invadens IP1]|eukprot:XP_004260185.1 serine/threonine protein phosphatase 2B catalytic subunit alpha isoform, putative [Entamoeba invadens IP1]